MWIHGLLESAHDAYRFGAPFGLDKRGHVSPCPMLGLERTVEPMHNQIDHIVDKPRVLVRVRRCGHRLRYYKMQVTVASVTKDDSIGISVFRKHGL